jgi:hypothetical protein
LVFADYFILTDTALGWYASVHHLFPVFVARRPDLPEKLEAECGWASAKRRSAISQEQETLSGGPDCHYFLSSLVSPVRRFFGAQAKPYGLHYFGRSFSGFCLSRPRQDFAHS